jgi:WXG100 family type VII secretion target
MYAHQIRAGEGTLVRAAGLVAEAQADFDRLAAELDSQILSAQGRWRGAGGTAFFTLHQQWTDKQRAIVGALERFRSGLVATATSLSTADENARSAAGTTLQRLGSVRS